MPTGFAAPVESGEVQDFPEFALLCARSFTPLVELRDHDWSIPIPRKLPKPTYHAASAKAAVQRLKKLKAMSKTSILRGWQEHVQDMTKRREDGRQRTIRENRRYEAMLDKVKSWEPPTKDHAGLKTFMVEQISMSMNSLAFYDDDRHWTLYPGPEAWHAAQIESAQTDIIYHGEKQEKDEARWRERNQWLHDLRRSLKEWKTATRTSR